MSRSVLGLRLASPRSGAIGFLCVLLGACTDTTAPPKVPIAVASIDVSANRLTLAVGDSIDMVATVRAANGSALDGREVQWSTSSATVATVTPAGRVVALTNGQTSISARSEGQEGRVLLAVATPPIEISSITPSPLRAGETAEIRGSGFNPRAGALTVTLDSVAMTLGPVTDASIVFTVPCVPSGTYALSVNSRGTEALRQPAAVQPRALGLAVGEFTVLPTVREAGCMRLPANTGPSTYLLTVFNTDASPTADAAIEWVGMRGAPVALLSRSNPGNNGSSAMAGVASTNRDAVHDAHLRREQQNMATARPTLRVGAQQLRQTPVTLAQNDLKRFYFTFGSSCNDTSRVFIARATAMGRRVAIWEDTANTVRASDNAALTEWYARLLRIADEEQLPLVQRLIGDPLGRDALTDADGLVHLVFSQRVNATGSGAYVSSCDLRPRQSALGGNNAEIIYGVAPTTMASNPESAESPDGWFSFMSRTVVHELKHLASYAARLNRQVPFEDVWLEEGTARMAEEAWAREYLYRQTPRSNAGFGSSADGGVYCDFHPASTECNANDRLHRPSYGMRRHFNDLRNKLVQPWNWSPFGDAPGQSGAVYYNSAWSLLRHTADHCCQSDSAFLTGLNTSDRVGLDNLSQVSRSTVERLLGAWGMALLADDRIELNGKAPVAQFLSWNFRSIYAGLNSAPAWQSRWTTPYPVVATPLAVDTLGRAVVAGPSIRGGGHAFYELTVPEGQAPLLHLRGLSNTALSETVRLALVRLR
jgi:Bacterial Ig-like domain (group 2)/IPT/TIG domain